MLASKRRDATVTMAVGTLGFVLFCTQASAQQGSAVANDPVEAAAAEVLQARRARQCEDDRAITRDWVSGARRARTAHVRTLLLRHLEESRVALRTCMARTTATAAPVPDGVELPQRRMTVHIGDEIGGSSGPETSGVVQRIRQRRAAMARCYEGLLPGNPSLGGTITVQLTIGQQGNVMDVHSIGNTSRNPALASCVVSPLARLRFPVPTGGNVTLAYPVELSPPN